MSTEKYESPAEGDRRAKTDKQRKEFKTGLSQPQSEALEKMRRYTLKLGEMKNSMSGVRP